MGRKVSTGTAGSSARGNLIIDSNTVQSLVANTDLVFTGAGTGVVRVDDGFEVTGTSKIQQIKEKCTISATAATGTVNFDVLTQGVLYYTANAAANFTLNIRGNAGASLDSTMSTGESLTIAFINTCGGTAYYANAFQVDGSSVTPKWPSGVAPTQGNQNSLDLYAVTVIKTGSAAFTVLASLNAYA
jgi:hypothetical protein